MPQKTNPKNRSKNANMKPSESLPLGVFVLIIIIFSIWIYKRNKLAKSRKYKQTNPYVATVDLQERYGGLEKRQVSIDDLSNEQLGLLERDGKLNAATIKSLREKGRLYDPENPNRKLKESKEFKVNNSIKSESPVDGQVVATNEKVSKAVKKRKKKKN
jgi:hypothetical protein